MSWELKGKYPKIFDDPKLGSRARELFDDAQKLLKQIVAEKRVTANAVYGFFPANTEGDDFAHLYRRVAEPPNGCVSPRCGSSGSATVRLRSGRWPIMWPHASRAFATTWVRLPLPPGST